MAKIKISKLGPIDSCELNIVDFMIFTGAQASGKSTISKSVFFFKNINKILLTTHSPYILGTVNNLLYANKISNDVEKSKLSNIIHTNKWLNYDNISAYHIQKGRLDTCLRRLP